MGFDDYQAFVKKSNFHSEAIKNCLEPIRDFVEGQVCAGGQDNALDHLDQTFDFMLRLIADVERKNEADQVIGEAVRIGTMNYDRARCPKCNGVIPEDRVRQAIEQSRPYICSHYEATVAATESRHPMAFHYNGVIDPTKILGSEIQDMVKPKTFDLAPFGSVAEGEEIGLDIPGKNTLVVGTVIDCDFRNGRVSVREDSLVVTLRKPNGESAVYRLAMVAGIVFIGNSVSPDTSTRGGCPA